MKHYWWILALLLMSGGQAAAQQRPADCAAPRGAILPGNQALDYCDALAAQVHEIRAAVELLQHNLRNGQYTGQRGPAGPQGLPGPPGRPGPPGQAIDLQPLLDRMQRDERWLTAIEARIDREIHRLENKDSHHAEPPDQRLETSTPTGQSAPALPNGRQGRTLWIEEVLRPVAAVVGNAYAGPVGGAMLTSAIGGIAWLIGRKKKD